MITLPLVDFQIILAVFIVIILWFAYLAAKVIEENKKDK